MRSPVCPWLAAVLLAASALAAGCGKGTSPTSPNNALTQDVADDVAINSVAALSTTGGDVAASVTVVQSGAPQPGAARLQQALWDTTFVRNGITFQASRTFY